MEEPSPIPSTTSFGQLPKTSISAHFHALYFQAGMMYKPFLANGHIVLSHTRDVTGYASGIGDATTNPNDRKHWISTLPATDNPGTSGHQVRVTLWDDLGRRCCQRRKKVMPSRLYPM